MAESFNGGIKDLMTIMEEESPAAWPDGVNKVIFLGVVP
jgi:hypothetical protein